MAAGRVGAAAAAVPCLTCSPNSVGPVRNSGISSVVDDCPGEMNYILSIGLQSPFSMSSHTGVVIAGRFSIVLKHVVLLKVPIVAKTTEDPIGLCLWLGARSSVDEDVVDYNLAGADRAGGFNVLKRVDSKLGKQISHRIIK